MADFRQILSSTDQVNSPSLIRRLRQPQIDKGEDNDKIIYPASAASVIITKLDENITYQILLPSGQYYDFTDADLTAWPAENGQLEKQRQFAALVSYMVSKVDRRTAMLSIASGVTALAVILAGASTAASCATTGDYGKPESKPGYGTGPQVATVVEGRLDEQLGQIDFEKLSYIAILLGVAVDELEVIDNIVLKLVDRVTIENNPQWMKISSSKNGSLVVLYNPQQDQFLKVHVPREVIHQLSKSPDQPTAVTKDFQVISAGVKRAFDLSDDDQGLKQLSQYVKLVKVKVEVDGQVEERLALSTRYLGQTVEHAFRSGDIPVADLPQLATEVFEAADDIYKATGYYNKDLNAKNVLIVKGPDGRRRIILIDFATSTGGNSEVTDQIKATAFRKFFRSLKNALGKELSLEDILHSVKEVRFRNVIMRIMDREKGSVAIEHLYSGFNVGLTIIGLALTAVQARAKYREYHQSGDNAQLDLHLYSLKNAGIPSRYLDQVLDPQYTFPLFHLPAIPITDEFLETIEQRLEEQGGRKPLILINNLSAERLPEAVPIDTDLEVGLNPSGKSTLYYKGTAMEVPHEGKIHLVTLASDEEGKAELWLLEAQLLHQPTFSDETGSSFGLWPYSIILKRLIFAAPLK